MDFLNRLLWMPWTAFVYSLDVMTRTMQEMQQTAREIANPTSNFGGTAQRGAANTFKEAGEMSDRDRDRCCQESCEVRLYEYYILSVKRGSERVIVGPKTVLITTNMNDATFAGYVIALFCQEDTEKARKIHHDDKKYLRVCARLVCSFPKECATDQVTVLEEIRDALRDIPWGGGGRPMAASA